MRNVLVLAAGAPREADGPRDGDLLDMALLEIIRALDVPARIASVLIPWSDELSPLVAAAIADTGPSFDPEGAATESSRSSLVPYLPSESTLSEQSALFLASSHLSLSERAPMTFAEAIREYPPKDVIVLSLTKDLDALRDTPNYGHAQFLVFGSLTPRDLVASVLGLPSSRVEDLELRLRPLDGGDIPEGAEFAYDRSRDEGVWSFVPFGVLVQDAFKEILPDESSSRRDAG